MLLSEAHLSKLLVTLQDALEENFGDCHVLRKSCITNLHSTFDEIEIPKDL